MLSSLGGLVVSIVSLIVDNWNTIGPVVDAVFGIISTALEQIGNVIGLFVAILQGDWSKAWGKIKDIVKTAFELILGIFNLYSKVGGLLWTQPRRSPR